MMYMGCLEVTVAVVSLLVDRQPRESKFSRANRVGRASANRALSWIRGMWTRGEYGVRAGSPVWARVAEAVNFCASFVSEWCCSRPFLSS